jgi:hypothetical protein
MKKTLVLLAIAGLTGCSAMGFGHYDTIEKTPFKGDLKGYAVVQVKVVSEQDEVEAVDQFQQQLVGEIVGRKVFLSIVTEEQPGNAEIKISVSLVFPGGHKVNAHVKATDLKSGELLGSYDVEGESNAGLATTRRHAVKKTAIAVVDYLAKQK